MDIIHLVTWGCDEKFWMASRNFLCEKIILSPNRNFKKKNDEKCLKIENRDVYLTLDKIGKE